MKFLKNRNKKKLANKEKILNMMIKLIIIGGLLFINVIFILNTIVMGKGESFITSKEDAMYFNADCVLVLGARVYEDGRLSLILRDRADTGIMLYKSGASKKILLSGDHGTKEYDEVNALREHTEEQGVPIDDIFLDHAGFSTYESIVRAKKVFGAQRIIIVTQRFHLYRAIYIAQSLGMEVIGVDATISDYVKSTIVKNELREEGARAKDWLYANILKPAPTYLGDFIDIKGSGMQTRD